MITIDQAMGIVANSISQYIEAEDFFQGYNVHVVSERVFLDDYAPKFEEYVARVNANMNPDSSYDMLGSEDGYEKPIEMPYQHTIIIILKLGEGETNFAIWNCPITMQVVSEENSFDMARQAVLSYIREKNFKYENGMVQTYYTPEITTSQQEMYAGFRALISVRGSLRIPEEGIVFVQRVLLGVKQDGGTGYDYYDYPFLNFSYDHTAVTDPQSFAGTMGAALTKNRQTSQSLSITTYLWHLEVDENDDAAEVAKISAWNNFSANVLGAASGMNKLFRFRILSNIEDPEHPNDFIPLADMDFVLISARYAQDWGGVEPWSLTFARAAEE